MKKFLFGIFLFCIPLIIVTIGCEIFLRNLNNEYRQKRDQLEANADSIEVLILGSSHAMDGINPDKFTLYAHNLAFAGQSIHFDRKLTEKYLPVLPNLKYAILMLDYNSLYYENDEGRSFFYKYYYDIDYKNLKYCKENISQTFFVYNPEIILSMIEISLKYKGYYKLVKGWINIMGRNDDFVTSVEKNRLRAKAFNEMVHSWDGGDSALIDLKEFISFLQAENITPILVNYPYYPLMRNFLDASVLESNKRIGLELSQKYQIHYLDYFDDDSFTIADFFNCDHLNVEGAAKISGKINDVIMNMEEKGIKNEKFIIPLLLDKE